MKVFAVILMMMIVYSTVFDIIFISDVNILQHTSTYVLVIFAWLFELIATFLIYRATFVKAYSLKQRLRMRYAVLLFMITNVLRGVNECQVTFDAKPILVNHISWHIFYTIIAVFNIQWILEIQESQLTNN